ncbi:MAG: hypothetical protein JXR60_03500 [Bacteroidales bacterium]|nr:hypothetical protein [Bacteroidales bacterium]
MNVKGTGLNSTRNFVKEKFPQKYQQWLNGIHPEAKVTYSGLIKTTAWYDVDMYYHKPLEVLADLAYNSDYKKAALDLGQFSADFGLKGVYKVFLLIATPKALMKAAKRIISLYYDNVDVHIDEEKKKSLILSTNHLSDKDDILDYRTIGWCVRALELANCKNVTFETVYPLYDNMFSVLLSWD